MDKRFFLVSCFISSHFIPFNLEKSKIYFPILYGQNFGNVILQEYLFISFSKIVLFKPLDQSPQFIYDDDILLEKEKNINTKKPNIKVYILFFFTINKYNKIFKGVNINNINIINAKHPKRLKNP